MNRSKRVAITCPSGEPPLRTGRGGTAVIMDRARSCRLSSLRGHRGPGIRDVTLGVTFKRARARCFRLSIWFEISIADEVEARPRKFRTKLALCSSSLDRRREKEQCSPRLTAAIPVRRENSREAIRRKTFDLLADERI